MKKYNFYLYDVILLILFVISNKFFKYLLILFTIFLILKHGIPKDKSYFKNNTIQIVIISVLAYFIISYSIGIITGFSRSFFNTSFTRIIKNIIPPLIIILSEETIRYIFAKNCINDKKPFIIITLLFSLFSCVSAAIGYNFNSNEEIFKYIFVIIFPVIAHQLLYSYITFNISLIPTIILRGILELYIYIVPFFPDIGNYLISASGIIFPYITYKPIFNMLQEYDKQKKYVSMIRKNYLTIPLFMILAFYISLISGLGRYKLIAIASGSMQPCFYRGDAILYKKIKNTDDIKIGSIIAYEKDKKLITHRVISIFNDTHEDFYKTKGDNNKNSDPFYVKKDMIKGEVISRIPYIGYPTIWLNDKFK